MQIRLSRAEQAAYDAGYARGRRKRLPVKLDASLVPAEHVEHADEYLKGWNQGDSDSWRHRKQAAEYGICRDGCCGQD